MWDERTRAAANELAASVVAGAGPGELAGRARALDVLGRLASWFSADGVRPEAEALLLESAGLARRIGQRTWEAQALVAVAMGFYFALCRNDRALATLDEVLAQLPAAAPTGRWCRVSGPMSLSSLAGSPRRRPASRRCASSGPPTARNG